MSTAVMFLAIAGILVLTVIAVWLFQRGVERDGGRPSASLGDGLGNLIDVFHPAGARAQRDLQSQKHQGPVLPVPDPDPEAPLRFELGPGGIPRRVTIRRR